MCVVDTGQHMLQLRVSSPPHLSGLAAWFVPSCSVSRVSALTREPDSSSGLCLGWLDAPQGTNAHNKMHNIRSRCTCICKIPKVTKKNKETVDLTHICKIGKHNTRKFWDFWRIQLSTSMFWLTFGSWASRSTIQTHNFQFLHRWVMNDINK